MEEAPIKTMDSMANTCDYLIVKPTRCQSRQIIRPGMEKTSPGEKNFYPAGRRGAQISFDIRVATPRPAFSMRTKPLMPNSAIAS